MAEREMVTVPALEVVLAEEALMEVVAAVREVDRRKNNGIH